MDNIFYVLLLYISYWSCIKKMLCKSFKLDFLSLNTLIRCPPSFYFQCYFWIFKTFSFKQIWFSNFQLSAAFFFSNGFTKKEGSTAWLKHKICNSGVHRRSVQWIGSFALCSFENSVAHRLFKLTDNIIKYIY